MRAGIRTCRQLDPESLARCQAKPSHANSHRHRGIQELAIGVHLTCSAWKTTAGEFTSTEVVYGVTGTDVTELPECGVSP
jgi:hypothetical protein